MVVNRELPLGATWCEEDSKSTCANTGRFRARLDGGPCFRCNEKGYQTEEDRDRNAKYTGGGPNPPLSIGGDSPVGAQYSQPSPVPDNSQEHVMQLLGELRVFHEQGLTKVVELQRIIGR